MMDPKVERLHKLLQKHVLHENLLVQARPKERGAWFVVVRDLGGLETTLAKLIKKKRRQHLTNSLVTKQLSRSVTTVFFTLEMLPPNPDYREDFAPSLLAYNPATSNVIYTEYYTNIETNDVRNYLDVVTFQANSSVAQAGGFPSSMTVVELATDEARIFEAMPDEMKTALGNREVEDRPVEYYQAAFRQLHDDWENLCMTCKTEEFKLKTCNGCKAARYCCKECQTKDWKDGHKTLCKLMGATARKQAKYL